MTGVNKVKASLAILGMTVAAVLGMGMSGSDELPFRQVETCQVRLGRVEQVLALDGVLRYEGEYAAISPTAGVVEQVCVRPGDKVEAGQLLFRLDGSTQAAAVASAMMSRDSLPDIGEQLASTQLREAAAQLESLSVRAAADGLVQQVNVNAHGGIAAGAAGVLLSGEKQCIQCSAVLRDALQLRPGMQARVLQSGTCMTTAMVGEIGAAQANSAGQVVCQVSLTPADALDLPLGATVEVEIILCGEENVPVVPMQAVTGSGTLWWVADGRAYEIPAQVLLADDVNCCVPLPEGTEIVCGGEALAEGQRVKAVQR